jgi:TRAP-type C4-dicarboxylate transport system permease small subunit
MTQVITAVSRLLSQAALVVAGLGLLAMTAIIGWQVIARYLLNASPAWSEQTALVLMIGFISFAAAVGVREGFHIGMTMAVDALPPISQRIARITSMLVVAGFGAGLGIFGAELVSQTWDHVLPTLGIPRGAAYLPLVVSGWLMVFFAAEQILAEVQGRKVVPQWS